MSILNFLKKPQPSLIPNKFTILVIEDNIELLEVLKAVKIPQEINVVYSSNALEAIGILKHQEINAILSDIQMENMDSLNYEINKLYSEIPVFRMSGSYPSFPNLMLSKPFSMPEYRSTLIQLYGLGKGLKRAS